MKNLTISAKDKAFTLIELLVVISIIALLLAILIPSLSKAKELAKRVICGNHLKTLTEASATYASANNGYFVPAGYSPYYYDEDNPGVPLSQEEAEGQSCRWLQNKTFRNYLNLDEYRNPDVDKGDMDSPDEFLCPADKISKNPANNTTFGVLTSYAYNVTDWNPWSGGSGAGWKNRIVGYRADSVKEPADKLNFIDGIDWWTEWPGARYKAKWDVIGQAPVWKYRPVEGKSPDPPPPHVYGAVYYRHNEGANIGFYDGHAEYMKKEKVFDYDAYNGPSPQFCGMWTLSGRVPANYNVPHP
jgi:prepilin-type N-terminal cleavage/methylation domain-containing protein/prepilin-type processing-associated H-X9-DG protein